MVPAHPQIHTCTQLQIIAQTTFVQGTKLVRVQRENVWQTESLSFCSLSLSYFESPRLQQWCYNGWWLIEMAVLNCIMSVNWWDHDHCKRLIFHSGRLLLQVPSSTVRQWCQQNSLQSLVVPPYSSASAVGSIIINMQMSVWCHLVTFWASASYFQGKELATLNPSTRIRTADTDTRDRPRLTKRDRVPIAYMYVHI